MHMGERAGRDTLNLYRLTGLDIFVGGKGGL